jgi:hypothetical protein
MVWVVPVGSYDILCLDTEQQGTFVQQASQQYA